MKKKIVIKGMSCGHCVSHVNEALKAVPGVESVEVNLTEKNAIVELTMDVSNNNLKTAIDEAGYEVVEITGI